MNTTVLFSTGKDNWRTPNDLFARLDAVHHFTLDAAADSDNHLTPVWFGPGGAREDALLAPWPTDQRIWLNPPYSKGAQIRFIERAVECARASGRVVALLPARTDTRLFHTFVWQHSNNRPRPWVRELRFLPGRVKFLNGDGLVQQGAPFPSMIVWFEL